jgi:predicted DNA-binding transcriptional regulator YafY
VGERDFELPELKLLVDSVQSSKFITHKKTMALIGKIESLASSHDAKLLQRQVFVRNRVKSMNESVYYTVDEISAAITADRAIRFHYFEYTVSKEQRLRRDGAFYTVSPFALLWDDENYYLLGYDHDKNELRHYRVDKMKDIAQTDEKRQGKADFETVDMSAYSQKVFGMFSGREELVKLRFAEHLVGTVIDRFGKDVMVIADGKGYFTVTLSLVVSPQFYGWLFGYGNEVEVLAPESVRCEVKSLASKVAAMYE